MHVIFSSKTFYRIALTTASMALAAFPLAAESPKDDLQRLQAVASNAKSVVEHATVAKQYRLQGESFEGKAVKHEAAVQRVSRQAHLIKWPGLAPKWLQDEKTAAVEALRAAHECYALADKHLRLAVEAQATD